jgi:anti-anti-sigma factor
VPAARVIRGEVDASCAERFRAALLEAAVEGPTIVLACSDLRFLDCRAARVLNEVGSLPQVDEIRLEDATPIVRKVLTLTGLAERPWIVLT